MSGSGSLFERFTRGKVKAIPYSWVALPLVFAAMLSQSLSNQGLTVLYPFIQEEFSLSHMQVGLITSSLSIGFAAVVAVAGWLTDSLGVKRMVTMSLLSIAILTIAFLLAYSWPFIIVLTTLIGTVSSPVYPATTRAVMEWFPQRIRALAMSLKQASVPVGGALTAGLLPVIAALAGWRMAAAAIGVFGLLVTAGFAFWYHDAPRDRKAVRKISPGAVLDILRNRCLVVTMVWGATFVGLYYIVISYFMLFLIEELRFSPIAAGGLLAMSQIISSICRIAWGAASDFIFHGRRIVVLAITGCLTVIWLLAAGQISPSTSGVAVMILAIVIGASTLSFQGVQITLTGELSDPKQIGTTVGIGSVFNHVSAVVMPPLFGYLVDLSGSYSLGWRAAAVVAVGLTVVLMIFGREPNFRQTSGAPDRR